MPLFRVILPANRLVGGDAQYQPLEVDELRLAILNLRLVGHYDGHRSKRALRLASSAGRAVAPAYCVHAGATWPSRGC